MTRRLLALFLLMSIALVGRSMAQHVDQIPPPITAFYQDRNFVSMFSNPAERSRVVAYSLLPEEAQKQEPLPQRLGTIAPMMARVERHVVDIDPRMNIPLGGRRERYPGYNEVVEIKEFRDFKNGLAVRVAACDVDPAGRALLVSIYERAGGDERELPPVNERLRLGRGRMCRDQIHYWSLVAGEWVTQTAHTAFLDETAR
ncbi:hypothetical protein EPO44_10570 [bacterium]|nr:MAG: hypothetical protein EPO44_10570 [bacterium]